MADSSPNSCFKGGRFCAPGFRFHPTDEELVVYYLKRKICGRKLRVNVIAVVDVYKWDPEELPGQSLLKSGDRQWFFFTPRSRKYPNGARSSRGTANGYWKVTGKDRTIVYNSREVGIKKTLVFYRGRAPNGERTDWVMHEYTMDEVELGKCQNAKDYYALYKLYKKSGAGPKNGEQYGAPFQEEEWADDDKEHTNNGPEAVPLAVQLDGADHVDDGVLTHDDLEELLKGIADAPQVPLRLEEYNSADVFEATEVTSAPAKAMEAAPLVFEKEDYIEMDDLLIPDLDAFATGIPSQPLNPDEFSGLNEFDLLFHDVAMAFDMDPISQGTAMSSFTMNDFANNTDDQKQQHPYHQLHQQALESEPDNLTDPSAVDPNKFTGDLSLQEEMVHFVDTQYYSEAFGSASSGVIHGPTNPPMSAATQDQGGENCPGTTSQLSNALWAFMESIPSTPASACEGPLNRTFVRMSSFSRIRFTAKANGTSVTNSTVVTKKASRNRGFLLLSILGALCAIFWAFMATVRVSERSIL